MYFGACCVVYGTNCSNLLKIFSSCKMDGTLYLFFSALLTSTAAWLLNPFGKLCSVLSYLFKSPQTANQSRP